MSMINKEIDDFTVQAFHNDDFETVTKDDVLGKWSVFFFYPADFTFVCPTELEDLGALYDKFQERTARSTRCRAIRISRTRPGTTRPRTSKTCRIRCWPTPRTSWPTSSTCTSRRRCGRARQLHRES